MTNIATHRGTLKTLDGKLEAPGADFDALKGEIITFYRLIETEVAELLTLLDEVTRVVEEWGTEEGGGCLGPAVCD